ncbi:murein hydrolase activator EnvC family protein [Granulosicoccus sp. 3-233]|uniref:murein hydrolase activator EnvC family protein n=1 Tax=Granulosicoccus sp. 3-233 TaxID=3417969 RepID=UPI003D3483BB
MPIHSILRTCRRFPVAVKPRNLATLALIAGCMLAGFATADTPRSLEDVEQQIQDTSEKLKALDNEIASSRKLKQKLQQALETARSHVGEREARLQQLDGDIAQFDKQLDKLSAMIADAQQVMESRRQALARALRNAQTIGKQTTLKVVLQHDDPALADRISVYTEHVLATQNRAIAEQVSQLNRMQAARESALKDRNWLNYIKKKASLQKEGYVSDASSRQQSLGEVEAELSQKTRTVAQLKADQSRLQSLMDELKTVESSQSGYFAAGKGNYPAPVRGELYARFNDIKSVGKLRWSGIFIKAELGRPVRAVADGEVVYSDFLRGFGMLVVIDHGDGYSSLYGGNREVGVTRGQWVESGATIATVGDSGGQNFSGVYFEIRHDATAEDPEKWLSKDFQVAGRP